MQSYIIRIYRFEKGNAGALVGVVEAEVGDRLSAQQSFSCCIFLNTAARPKLFERFKGLKQIQIPMGKLKVRLTRNGSTQEIHAQNPPTGGTATYAIGPVP